VVKSGGREVFHFMMPSTAKIIGLLCGWQINEIGVWSIGGMKLTGENEVLEEKPVPVSICPPQIPHGMTWGRTQDSMMTGMPQW
jgi:hypothetical protein